MRGERPADAAWTELTATARDLGVDVGIVDTPRAVASRIAGREAFADADARAALIALRDAVERERSGPTARAVRIRSRPDRGARHRTRRAGRRRADHRPGTGRARAPLPGRSRTGGIRRTPIRGCVNRRSWPSRPSPYRLNVRDIVHHPGEMREGSRSTPPSSGARVWCRCGRNPVVRRAPRVRPRGNPRTGSVDDRHGDLRTVPHRHRRACRSRVSGAFRVSWRKQLTSRFKTTTWILKLWSGMRPSWRFRFSRCVSRIAPASIRPRVERPMSTGSEQRSPRFTLGRAPGIHPRPRRRSPARVARCRREHRREQAMAGNPPKRKVSRSNTRSRRAQWKAAPITLTTTVENGKVVYSRPAPGEGRHRLAGHRAVPRVQGPQGRRRLIAASGET